ncbi:MAG: class I SAM-dependent methyltransferase [Candidatus Methylomirabilia bacterium]
MSEAQTYLNLGCGSRCHPDWVNIDIVARAPGVIRHDLSRGIPLRDESCAVVYHAAVLEHLRRPDAVAFVTECRRVLKPGGVLRVGVPDLERICRLYLGRLESALAGAAAAAHDYDWVMLELYDQTTREKRGGEMLEYLRQRPLPNQSFVLKRIGVEGRELLAALRAQDDPRRRAPAAVLRTLLRRFRSLPAAAARLVMQVLLGAQDWRALEIGRFRLSGEAHQWMYDRFSLARLLEQAGFIEARVCDAATSRIPEWGRYNLDTLPDGEAIKPDLFFMEAVKPGEAASCDS